jgi:hypothetical protein
MKTSPFTSGTDSVRIDLQDRILEEINKAKEQKGEPTVEFHEVFTDKSVEKSRPVEELPQATEGFDPSLIKADAAYKSLSGIPFAEEYDEDNDSVDSDDSDIVKAEFPQYETDETDETPPLQTAERFGGNRISKTKISRNHKKSIKRPTSKNSRKHKKSTKRPTSKNSRKRNKSTKRPKHKGSRKRNKSTKRD